MDEKNIFLTSALVGGEWSASRPGRFTAGERTPRNHWKGGWVDPRAGLDDVKNILYLTENLNSDTLIVQPVANFIYL
jgi:hypothetical protein